MDWNTYKSEFEKKANLTLDWLILEFNKVSSGRPNVKFFESIWVEAYDSKSKLYDLANLQVVGGKQLIIKPYDRSLIVNIINAILKENLGFNPLHEADKIRILFPTPTEENRLKGVKKIKDFLEKGKIGLRNARNEVNKKIKKDEELREDELKDYENSLNKLTKQWNDKLEKAYSAKEKEITSF